MSCCCFALLPFVALHHPCSAQAEARISFGVHASGANISNSVVVAVSSSSSQAIGDSQDSSQVPCLLAPLPARGAAQQYDAADRVVFSRNRKSFQPRSTRRKCCHWQDHRRLHHPQLRLQRPQRHQRPAPQLTSLLLVRCACIAWALPQPQPQRPSQKKRRRRQEWLEEALLLRTKGSQVPDF